MDIALAHGMYGYGFNPFVAFFGFLFNVLFFVFFVWFVLFLVKGFRRGRWGRGSWKQMRYAGGPSGRGERMRGWFSGSDDAVEVARERFAKGEISQEQYQAIKAALEAEQAKRESREDGGWRGFWGGDNALSIARERFARGEITLEEYEAIKRGLEG